MVEFGVFDASTSFSLGFVAPPGMLAVITPQHFASMRTSENARLGEVIRKNGIRAT